MKLRYQLYLLKVPEFEESALPAVFSALPKSFDREAFAEARKQKQFEEPILVAQAEIQEEITAIEATLAKNGCRCLSVDAGSDFKRFFEQFRTRYDSARARAGRISALMRSRDARDSDNAHDPEAEARRRMILIGVGVGLFLAVLLVLYVLQSRALDRPGTEVDATEQVRVPDEPNAWLAFTGAGQDAQRMQALAAQMQAVAADEDNPALHLELAETYAALQNFVEARSSLERALRRVGDADDELRARIERRLTEIPRSAALTRFLMEGVRELYDRSPEVRQRAHVPGTGPVARYTVSLRERHDGQIRHWQDEGRDAVLLRSVAGFSAREAGEGDGAIAAAVSVRLGACRESEAPSAGDVAPVLGLLLEGVAECEPAVGAGCAAAVGDVPCGLLEERIEWLIAERVSVSEAVAARVMSCLEYEGVPTTEPLQYGMWIEGWAIGAALPEAAESVGESVDWAAGLLQIECAELADVLSGAPAEVLASVLANAGQSGGEDGPTEDSRGTHGEAEGDDAERVEAEEEVPGDDGGEEAE